MLLQGFGVGLDVLMEALQDVPSQTFRLVFLCLDSLSQRSEVRGQRHFCYFSVLVVSLQ